MKNNKVARKNEDFRIHYTDYFGIIRYSESLTNHAKSNSEFEGHVHYDEFELYYFIKGDISFSVEGRRIAVKEGDMIIIVSGLIHRPIINRECVYHRRHILFHKDIFKRLNGTDYEFFRMLMKKKIWVLDRCVVKEKGFDTMYNQIEAYVRNQTAYAGFCGMIEIFSFLVRAQECGRELLDIDEQMYNEKVEMLLKYIEEHLTETLNYEVLAEAFYFSTKNLYKFFKKETGFTLSDYINERRIIKAQSLLNAGVSATEAAAAAGYRDYSVFYRNFVKRVGIPPAKFGEFKYPDAVK